MAILVVNSLHPFNLHVIDQSKNVVIVNTADQQDNIKSDINKDNCISNQMHKFKNLNNITELNSLTTIPNAVPQVQISLHNVLAVVEGNLF